MALSVRAAVVEALRGALECWRGDWIATREERDNSAHDVCAPEYYTHVYEKWIVAQTVRGREKNQQTEEKTSALAPPKTSVVSPKFAAEAMRTNCGNVRALRG